MKRSIIISFHAAYWLIYLFLSVSTLIVAGDNFKGNGYESLLLNLFLAGTCFYMSYLVLVPKFLAHRKVKKFGLLALLISFLSAVIIVTVHVIINQKKTLPDVTIDNTSSTLPVILNWIMIIGFHTIIGMIHGLLASLMKGFFAWYDDIHVKEFLEKKNLETQMALIKARIDPHFLFNTLNNIDVLIKNDPWSASVYLQKLCNIMRFTLYENHATYIPLQKEIEIMKEYIEIERIRSVKNFISVEVTGDSQGKSIAPMILLPFVENAIKHSEGRKTNNAVLIKLGIDDSHIKFICKNVIGTPKKRSEGGIGIDLIKERLNLLYPKTHEILLTEKDEYYEVKLTIATQ